MDAWKKLFSVSYDNCIRGYDVVTGALEHEWVNERRCHFVWIEVGCCVFNMGINRLCHVVFAFFKQG